MQERQHMVSKEHQDKYVHVIRQNFHKLIIHYREDVPKDSQKFKIHFNIIILMKQYDCQCFS